jgi:hypothetical protein
MNKKEILIIIALFAITSLIVVFVPGLSKSYIKTGKLYISEIMASNYKTIKDNYGDYSDYIEIYNGGKRDINLSGYHLSDSEFETKKWSFPEIYIKSGEYLIIYASNRDECDLEDRICHTNFKLSSKGEVLTLTDDFGNIINKFTYPELAGDIAYGYAHGKYIKFKKPTPGKENSSEEEKTKNYHYKLEITEYMTHNKRSVYDEYGNYYDFVEIHNKENKDIVLENVYITDEEENLNKFRIPKTNLSKDGYLVIYLSSDKVSYENGIYADFGLSDTDKMIIISYNNKKLDEVEVVPLKDNISYGKVGKSWKYFTTPTPGQPNTTASFTRIGGADENT